MTALPALEYGESLALYSVKNGALSGVLSDDFSLGDGITAALAFKGITGVALVKIAPPAEDRLVEGKVLWANDYLYLTGKMPGNAVVEAVPVTVTVNGRPAVAFDINIYPNANQQAKGHTWQPAGDKVQVRFYSDRFGSEAVDVYHLADANAEPEYVDTVRAEDGWIEFEAESFSVYAAAEAIETTVEVDGQTYQITATYDGTARIPAGAELSVTELDAADYHDATLAALNGTAEDLMLYSKALDVSIVANGEKIEPQAPVEITVRLLDVTAGAEARQVVHVGAAGAEKLPSTATTTGEVTFETDSFSPFILASILSEKYRVLATPASFNR